MERKQRLNALMILIFSLMLMACAGGGAEDSLPSEPSASAHQTTTLSGVLPTIDFSFENTVSPERSLQRGPRGEEQRGPRLSSNATILERWVKRMDHIIEETNRIVSVLNSEELDATGSFTGKGRDGLISGTISELSDDPTYHYEALVCYDSTGFLSVKWSEDESQIETTKDFSARPSHRGDSATNLVSKVIYTESGRKTTVEMTAHGTPWHRRGGLTDEGQMTHYMYGQKILEGATFIRGVQDWYTTVPESFTADGYLTGIIEADGSGEYVAYLSSKDECEGIIFDEDAVTGESWCLGKAIGSDTEYTPEELSQAWDNLSGIGIAEQSNLQALSLETNLSCP